MANSDASPLGASYTHFNLLGGNLCCLVPHGTMTTSCPIPSRSIWTRVNCKAVWPWGRFLVRTRYVKANIEKASRGVGVLVRRPFSWLGQATTTAFAR